MNNAACIFFFFHSTTSLDKYRNTYLFVFPIPVGLETIRRMELNGGAADHLNTTFLIFCSRWTYTAVHLHVVPTNIYILHTS